MPLNKITSLTNPRIKHVVQLRQRKYRQQQGLTIVEGRREIMRALDAGIECKELYLCRELTDNREIERVVSGDVAVYEVPSHVYAKIAYGDRGEGLLAVCVPRRLTFTDCAWGPDSLLLVVDQVEKPGNVGAILRTCDGAGVDGMILCDANTDIDNPNVIRASLGAVFSVKVVVSSSEETLAFLRKHNIKICTTSPDAKDVYTAIALTGGVAVVVGSEEKGLSKEWIENADMQVNIPMHGRADSLNVSVSTGVLLYEAIRQRNEAC